MEKKKIEFEFKDNWKIIVRLLKNNRKITVYFNEEEYFELDYKNSNKYEYFLTILKNEGILDSDVSVEDCIVTNNDQIYKYEIKDLKKSLKKILKT